LSPVGRAGRRPGAESGNVQRSTFNVKRLMNGHCVTSGRECRVRE
jgi:hypothetical protein